MFPEYPFFRGCKFCSEFIIRVEITEKALLLMTPLPVIIIPTIFRFNGQVTKGIFGFAMKSLFNLLTNY